MTASAFSSTFARTSTLLIFAVWGVCQRTNMLIAYACGRLRRCGQALLLAPGLLRFKALCTGTNLARYCGPITLPGIRRYIHTRYARMSCTRMYISKVPPI
ncbi:hypothetical protein GGS23DRAFT_33877 [Durotheca rogersii]|uniref:uncharacterized protein n=1 Tax=Durotheca rogersii TaxID=419775 RepID=UPI0022206227|nr:uncharacterized protein GGS23DRAFT_33877 [Durotheca rogersii]KAI5868502.1 hypothetical protein GGS23DRAFT_33877 [Durotheca rogersii]